MKKKMLQEDVNKTQPEHHCTVDSVKAKFPEIGNANGSARDEEDIDRFRIYYQQEKSPSPRGRRRESFSSQQQHEESHKGKQTYSIFSIHTVQYPLQCLVTVDKVPETFLKCSISRVLQRHRQSSTTLASCQGDWGKSFPVNTTSTSVSVY